MAGELFSDFGNDNFPNLFQNSANSKDKIFLQDEDPCQKSKGCIR